MTSFSFCRSEGLRHETTRKAAPTRGSRDLEAAWSRTHAMRLRNRTCKGRRHISAAQIVHALQLVKRGVAAVAKSRLVPSKLVVAAGTGRRDCLSRRTSRPCATSLYGQSSTIL